MTNFSSRLIFRRMNGLMIIIFSILIGFISSINPSPAAAVQNCEEINCNSDQSPDEYLDCNKSKQRCWEEKISITRQAANTLQNTIGILSSQISLQQLQVSQTVAEISQLETEISQLSDYISKLSLSLDKLTGILIERVRTRYKQSRLIHPLSWLVSDSLSQIVTQFKYLAKTQQQTADAMQLTETQRQLYDQQKQLKEKKQTELETKRVLLEQQKLQLDRQKNDQQYLLAKTQNDEARYQKELATTMAELQAIQSIIAGKGVESKVKDVNEGDTIASIIVGASACSTGTHLHFEVVKDGTHRDPAGFLQSADVTWQNQPDSSFGFGGSWRWPVNDAARITQGYGMTYYARVMRMYQGSPHTGIDILSKSSGNYDVKAVKNGELFRGSISCGGGLLRYVKVKHESDSIATYYLHINY